MLAFLNKLLNLSRIKVTDYKIVDNKIYLNVQSAFDEVLYRKYGKPAKSKGYAKKKCAIY